jgi:hypothetical protein
VVTHVETVEEAYQISNSTSVWQFRPQNRGRQVCRVWASKFEGGSEDGTWYHWRDCMEAKLSREVLVAVWCKELILDHFTPGLCGSGKISMGNLGMCNSPINEVTGCPRQSLPSRSLAQGSQV